ncbi:hypothetical protein CEXT_481991 [Caerostris extrusa]|uniref:Uncharacterized protein n=1 Tax=Caerostris extrusa TaxID=172846 RepID=A0AAV4XL21_CAEEX|nr:hypothetical protein CEXT_481991 [Caerostris extrusa]
MPLRMDKFPNKTSPKPMDSLTALIVTIPRDLKRNSKIVCRPRYWLSTRKLDNQCYKSKKEHRIYERGKTQVLPWLGTFGGGVWHPCHFIVCGNCGVDGTKNGAEWNGQRGNPLSLKSLPPLVGRARDPEGAMRMRTRGGGHARRGARVLSLDGGPAANGRRQLGVFKRKWYNKQLERAVFAFKMYNQLHCNKSRSTTGITLLESTTSGEIKEQSQVRADTALPFRECETRGSTTGHYLNLKLERALRCLFEDVKHADLLQDII